MHLLVRQPKSLGRGMVSPIENTRKICTLKLNEAIWYDMIWYDFILFAQNRGPKAELQYTILDKKKKKKSMTRNNAKRTTIDNRETRPNCEAGEQRRK